MDVGGVCGEALVQRRQRVVCSYQVQRDRAGLVDLQSHDPKGQWLEAEGLSDSGVRHVGDPDVADGGEG